MADAILGVLTRAQARVEGKPRYFTGTACTHGHQAERYVSSSNCVECTEIRNRLPETRAAIRKLSAAPKAKAAAKLRAAAIVDALSQIAPEFKFKG